MEATVRAVRQALGRLHDLPYLQTHPLAGRFGGGEALQRCLLEAIDQLGGQTARAGRAHRLLVLRYREGLAPAAVQRELGLAKSQYYAEQARAVAAVASLVGELREPAAWPAPARGGAAPHGNLPAPLTGLVGRTAEVAAVTRLLGTTRLLTLVGVGGCGKTRLALAVAQGVGGRYPDGIRLVELAPLADPVLLPTTVAAALGVQDRPRQPLRETLVAHLRPRRLLLVLDNCEHLVAACARLAADLLQACPTLAVLATSREPLGVPGELIWRVPPLGLPDPTRLAAGRDDPVAVLLASEAAQLFCQRAARAAPGFAATARNAAAIAEVCQRLDGLPLALELAAGRTAVLSVEEIAARLDDRFRLLTGGSRTAPTRQQTLRAALDWSHDLLGEAERAVLRRASVFAGGFALEAAEAVCSSAPRPADPAAPPVATTIECGQVFDALARLVDTSLVVADRRGAETRYRLLETVRAYGAERLVEAGEADAARDRLVGWCTEFCERAEAELTGAGQRGCLRRLARELDNLRAALAWARRRAPDAELRLAGSLWRFWMMRGYLAEGRTWLEGALGRASDGSAARAKALVGAGILAREQGDNARALSLLREGAAWWRRAGARGPLGHALLDVAACLFLAGEDAGRVEAVLRESLALSQEVGDDRGVAWALHFLGAHALETGEHDRGRALVEQAVALFRRVGDGWSLSQTLGSLGQALFASGDLLGARRVETERLVLARRLGNRDGLGGALRHLGRLAAVEGDLDRAGRFLRRSLRAYGEAGDADVAYLLGDLGALAVRRGDHARGVRLLAAGAVGDGATRGTLDYVPQDEWRTCLDAARAGLGPEGFEAVWAEGRALARDQAVAIALRETPGERPVVRDRSSDGTVRRHLCRRR
jgi:non-specific serine/threonine protein kinase